MKVLMINVVCGIRSTGRICTDLATALEEHGHEVKIAYGRENVPIQYQKYAIRISSEFEVRLHAIKARLMDADGLGSKLATKRFIKWVEEYDPDVIHLHNLHGYYINVPILFEYILKYKKRVVWTLHDCWAFTGHSGTCDLVDCEKWTSGCGKCPLSKDYPKSFVDYSKRNFNWKKKLFLQVENITFVTPSHWLEGLVKRSFLQNKSTVVIHNGIDITQFKPLKNDFREVYGLEKKIILLGCASSWGKGKGLDDFVVLAKRLDNRFAIVLVGLTKLQIDKLPSNIVGIERTQSLKELANIYSSADLFLNLTYCDNFPTVNLEALSCGTPVITYNTGGSAECLKERNGRSFKKGDLESIIYFLEKEYTSDLFAVDCEKDETKTTLNKKDVAEKYETLICESMNIDKFNNDNLSIRNGMGGGTLKLD